MGLFDRSKKSKKSKTDTLPLPPPPPPRPQPSRNAAPAPVSSPFQHAGYLPSQPGWMASPPPPSQGAMQPYRQYPPVIVHQHYYLSPPPTQPSLKSKQSSGALSKLKLGSMVDLTQNMLPQGMKFDDGLSKWHCQGTQLLNQTAALVDQISHKFNDVMTLIDGDRYHGNEGELFTYQQQAPQQPAQSQALVAAPATAPRGSPRKDKSKHKDNPKGQTTAVAASVISGNSFAKVELYANSRLPLKLPPLKLYISTYPLLTLAATYSERVYDRPTGAERAFHLPADWRSGTKATILKSVPMDSMNTIVFAIRGTATFMDWAVNLNTAPASPLKFLDDPGNFCHAGFLAAARKMVKPVAARLRQLLEEDPGRAGYSLMITGHSAGGAIASLLYSHMLSTSKDAQSELTALAGVFRRIHCVTFGTPPVSLLPLQTPARRELRKSLFLSFINEGDPVARADKAYIKSLLDLFATPAPSGDKLKVPSSGKSKSSSSLVSAKSHKSSSSGHRSGPIWPVPPSTLSNAGRIVVLRSGNPKPLREKRTVEERLNEGVVAQVVTDEQLRGVIWGDPVAHVMRFYAGRIETLAVGAITAQGS